MNIGAFIHCHNDAGNFDRIALSLHDQKHTDWRGFVFDYKSTDNLERITWAYHHVRDCDLLRDKFLTYQSDEETIRSDIDNALSSAPFCHVIVLLNPGVRLQWKCFEVLSDAIEPGVDWYAFPVNGATVHAFRPEALVGKLSAGEDGWNVNEVEAGEAKTVCRMPLGWVF